MSIQANTITKIVIDFTLYKKYDLTSKPTSDDIILFPDNYDILGIYISSAQYSLVDNNFSRASIALSFRGSLSDKDYGINKLAEIFPTGLGNNDKYQYYGKIELRANNTSLSSIQKGTDNPILLFFGEVIGYGMSVSSNNISYNINLISFLSNLSDFKIAIPGLYGDVPFTYNFAPLSYNAKESPIVGNIQALIEKLTNNKNNPIENGLDLYDTIIENYEDAVQNANSPSAPANLKHLYKNVIDIFKDISNNLFDYLSLLDYNLTDIKVPSELYKNLVRYITYIWLSKPELSFWELLLIILETFGLNLLDYGPRYTVYGKANLLDPSEFRILNNIQVSDILNLEIGDQPFNRINKVIISTSSFGGYYSDAKSLKTNALYGIYPKDNLEGTPRYLFYDTPFFLSYFIYDSYKYTVKQLKQRHIKYNKKSHQIDKTKSDNINFKAQQIVADKYAKYFYMLKRFEQRTGSVSLRFMPNIVPGLPCKIYDPFKQLTFDCYILQTTHSIDATSGSLSTTVSFNNIRYPGDIDEYPFKNVIYPNTNLKTIEGFIIDGMGLY